MAGGKGRGGGRGTVKHGPVVWLLVCLRAFILEDRQKQDIVLILCLSCGWMSAYLLHLFLPGKNAHIRCTKA